MKHPSSPRLAPPEIKRGTELSRRIFGRLHYRVKHGEDSLLRDDPFDAYLDEPKGASLNYDGRLSQATSPSFSYSSCSMRTEMRPYLLQRLRCLKVQCVIQKKPHNKKRRLS